MTKNVNVVDENGNRYVPTYAKRAKGLVKNGRARWLDENTICLACPPDHTDLEDTTMNNEIISLENIPAESTVNEDAMTNQKAVQTRNEMADSMADLQSKILERIDRIIEQGEGLAAAIREIQAIPVNDSPYGGQDGASRAKAIGDVIRKREETNQMMIDLLKRMYDDANHRKQMHDESLADKLAKFDWVGVSAQTAELILKAVRSE